MIVIINYGMGNVQSVKNALEALNENAIISDDKELIAKSKAIIIPGVGAFGDAMRRIKEKDLLNILHTEATEKKKPILGICLGMQLLATKSFEHGEHQGFGWVDATIERIQPNDSQCKIPHMGWNNLIIKDQSILFKDFDLNLENCAYFVHSFAMKLSKDETKAVLTSTVDHGGEVTASVRKGNVFGTQFHPEKSQNVGLKILQNFIQYIKEQQREENSKE